MGRTVKRLRPAFTEVWKTIEAMRLEISGQERRWRLITGKPTTGELDRSGFFLDILQNLYNEEDIRGLLFDMNVKWEALPGENANGKARELVLLCQRTRRLTELYERIREARPYIFEEGSEYSHF